jgi:ATP-dependent Clp protease ATP-binding subunit ClpA
VSNLNNFTLNAHEAMLLARKEAERLRHGYIGTEHMLLGIIQLGRGTAVTVLEKLGISLESVRVGIEKEVGFGPVTTQTGTPSMTPLLRKVLALAASEARSSNCAYVGSEHILLGILREDGGGAARVLRSMNVDLKKVRTEVMKELDPNYEEEPDIPSDKPVIEKTELSGLTILGERDVHVVEIEGRGGDSARDEYFDNEEDAILASAVDGQNRKPRIERVVQLSNRDLIEMPKFIRISKPPTVAQITRLEGTLTPAQRILQKRRADANQL